MFKPKKVVLTKEEMEVAWTLFRTRMAAAGQVEADQMLARCVREVALAKEALLNGFEEPIMEGSRRVGTRIMRVAQNGQGSMVERPR